MKAFRGRKVLTSLVTLAVAAVGAAGLGREYLSENGFQPFDTDRELQNKQVLFPDGEGGSQVQDGASDTQSFWEKDENGQDDTGFGIGAGYLLSRGDQTLVGDLAKTLNANAAGADNLQDGLASGDSYEITDKKTGTDLIISGGSQNGSGSGGGSGTNSGNNNGNNNGTDQGDNGKDDGKGDNGSDEQPGPGANLTRDPIPGNGSNSRDEVSTDPVPPSSVDSDASQDFSQAAIDRLKAHEYEVIFAQPEEINRTGAEALYKGQKNVDELTLFQSIDSYVWDEDDQKAYYWTCDDLDTGKADGHAKHVRITGVVFETDGREEKITEFPLEILADADSVTIYLDYRLDVKDAWTEYSCEKEYWGEVEETTGVDYMLQNARILVLNQIVESKGQTILRENVLNSDRQYVNEENQDEGLNLLEYQGALLGADNTGKMSGLFPGWKEDGKFVEFSYSTEGLVGRHVLEPAALVPFDRERFQINLRSHYMNADYEVGWSAGAKYISLQALTDYTGSDKLPMTETEYDRVDTLEVPQYVQAVEFDYTGGFSVNHLKLPDSVLYVNTDGIPSLEDNGILTERGLQVVESYEVSENNPRYASENGLLYNKDKTELLGVPTGLGELDVEAGIEKVVLPYQNHLKYLRLHILDTENLPKINYERLSAADCKIVVPDRLLSAYMDAEKDMLRQTGLKVVAESNLDAECTLQDSFLLRGGSQVQEILRSKCTWLTLPKYVTGVDASALQKFQRRTSYAKPLEAIVLPADGQAVTFGEGSFDGFEKMTIGCYSEEQVKAVEALQAEYPSCTFMIGRMTVRDDGYRYLQAGGDVILCGVPDGIAEFYGVIPGLNGEADIPVTVVGDWAFAENRNGYNLQWMVLPESVRGVGYEAFKDCWSLEGALIEGAPENGKKEFVISEKAFDNCLWLRFLGCNADKIYQYGQGMSLADDEQDESYSFLFCKKSAEINDYSWTSFYDVDHYVMENCGGTRVLYGASADGTPFRALRSGVRTRESVTLPITTTEIYRGAFRNFYNPDWAPISFNWEELTALRLLGKYSFAGSYVGAEVTLPENMELQTRAFSGCIWLTKVTAPGTRGADGTGGVSLGRDVFINSSALTEVFLGELRAGTGLYPELFYGTALTGLHFTGTEAPDLNWNMIGKPFYFVQAQEEAGALRITVPEGAEASYIQKWCCKLSGYEDYETLWDQTGWRLRDELLRTPTDDEIRAAVNRSLLELENRVRKLLGMEAIDDAGDLIFPVPETEKETAELTKELPETEEDQAQQAETADTEKQDSGKQDTDTKDTGKEPDSSEQKEAEETKETEETEP